MVHNTIIPNTYIEWEKYHIKIKYCIFNICNLYKIDFIAIWASTYKGMKIYMTQLIEFVLFCF